MHIAATHGWQILLCDWWCWGQLCRKDVVEVEDVLVLVLAGGELARHV